MAGNPVIFKKYKLINKINKKGQKLSVSLKMSHLVSTLVNISGCVVVHSEHRNQTIRITVCLKIKMIIINTLWFMLALNPFNTL